MNVRPCFSHDDVAVVHLACTGPHNGTTLCGKRAFLATLSRRKVTCADCVRLKPKQMGGA